MKRTSMILSIAFGIPSVKTQAAPEMLQVVAILSVATAKKSVVQREEVNLIRNQSKYHISRVHQEVRHLLVSQESY